MREWLRLLCSRANVMNFLTRHEVGWASVDAVYRELDCFVASRLNSTNSLSGVYAYEDCALHSFSRAKQLGLRCFYDLPIAYWRFGRALWEEEVQLNPEWAPTMPGYTDSQAKLDRKDEEIALSDIILVASTFTKRSLKLAPDNLAPIIITKYGAPLVTHPKIMFNADHKLRLLFVGSLTQRKGLSYLFDAIELLPDKVRLTLIGSLVGSCQALNQRLQSHRWIPSLPHSQVLQEMREHDVLVFPSLFEGFGLVILEAMAQGLPIITTAHTGAPDIMKDGTEGFIIPIRSVEAIYQAINNLYKDRGLLQRMGQAAQKRAAQLTWENYGQMIIAAIEEQM